MCPGSCRHPYLTRAYEIWAADGPADDADDAVILADTNLPGDLGFAFSGAPCAAGNMPPLQWPTIALSRTKGVERTAPTKRRALSHLEMTQSLILTGPIEKCLDIVWRMI